MESDAPLRHLHLFDKALYFLRVSGVSSIFFGTFAALVIRVIKQEGGIHKNLVSRTCKWKINIISFLFNVFTTMFISIFVLFKSYNLLIGEDSSMGADKYLMIYMKNAIRKKNSIFLFYCYCYFLFWN